MNIPVVVSCSDKYLWCLKPFSVLFSKYCPGIKRVDVAGYSTPDFELPNNFNFNSIATTQYPKEKWADGFLKFLYTYKPDHFVLLLEDYWLCRYVDKEGIEVLTGFMESNTDVLRVDLTSDRLYAGGMRDIGPYYRFDLVEAPNSQYQMSLQAGIWNKKLLIEVLEQLSPNNRSAWNVELDGTGLVNSNKMKVYGTRQNLIRYVNGMNNGKPGEINLDGFIEKDKQIIKTYTMAETTTQGYTSNNLIDWLGYIKHDEAEFLKTLCLSLPENPFVVNIGAGAGTSALIFLESRPDLTSCTVDIRAESSPYGCLEGEMNALKQSNVDLSRHQQVHGDSVEVGKKWKGKSPDLVFIDGNHTYEGCKGDIEAWLPLLKPGGVLAIHDYNKTEKEYPGVNDSVNELLLGKYHKIDHKTYSLIAFRNEKI